MANMGYVDLDRIDRLERTLYNLSVINGDFQTNEGGATLICGGEEAAASGSTISWAKITGVTDANNYTASIWTDRNETDPAETSKALYVYDIADALAINDWIPVQPSNRTGKDYENIQQLGLL